MTSMKYATLKHTHLQQNGDIQSFHRMKPQSSTLAVFAGAVETSVEEAEPLLQVVSL